MSDYDFIVLGGGSAGYAAARTATEHGLKSAVVEGGQEIGGLCILRGCMPSKTLIESANRYRTLQRAQEFGLKAGEIGFDAKAIIARKRRLIGEFADYRSEQLQSGKFDFLRGMASFVDPHTVTVRDSEGRDRAISAKSFLIATGSSITVPEIPGLAEAGYLTSDTALESEHIPKSITVLGAGPVALELAHYFGALGSEVTIIQRSGKFLTGTDPELADVVETAFRKRGMRIYTHTKLLRVEKYGDVKHTFFEHEGREQVAKSEAIFVALGRKPNTSFLNLPVAEVRTEKGHILTQPTQQTSVPHLFAAGDVCGPYEIVHIAIQQGEIAARNAAQLIRGKGGALETTDYRLKLYVVFTEPQVAVVGMNEEECAKANIPCVSAKYPFVDHGKSLVMGETEGFVKLVAHAESGEILGGGVAGPHASDLIHEIVVAMSFRATAAQFAAIPHYHPTLSEIWSYPAEEIAEQLKAWK